MDLIRWRQLRRVVLVCGMVWASGVAVFGEVTDLSADINASLTELVDNETGSTDASFEQYPETAPALPITAFAGLGNFNGETGESFGARAIAEFEDPTLSNAPNPAELGVELDVFSSDPQISYVGVSEVVETRSVTLSAEELGVAAPGDENLSFSSAFINGAMVIWCRDEDRDLTGLSGTLDFVVTQTTGGADPEVVLELMVRIDGQPGGDVQVVRSDVLDVRLGGPELLAVPGDADAQALVDALEDTGRVHVLVVPLQQIQYAYFAQAEEPFELQVDVTCRAANLTDGTGVAAAFGRDFSSLAVSIQSALPLAKADEFQAAMNRLMAEPADGQPANPAIGPLCGAFGGEVGLVSMLGFWGCAGRSRRRRGV